ncbi:MAG: serine hydrolase [Burkholderiales bacterium RIFCSPLOWO2_02_FULL_57_36]|nr:MAG: serine hydrolase [Burkholderiales bacterium RIFCSPLOWO2_02_FULL_57_36]
MTKPIVSVGLMMLVEEGKLLISDPVSKYLPELSGLKVGVEKTGADGTISLSLVPVEKEMTVQDLLRHTSGLTYGIFGESLVKSEYRQAGVERSSITNSEFMERLAIVPLAYQPGTTWEYSRSTDVLGILIERISGVTLDVYVDERILKPLKMKDSGFWVPPDQHHRIAQAFQTDPDTGQRIRLLDVRSKPSFLSGGGGMVSTARDYLRFANMLRGGGAYDGVRLLSRKTVQYMTSDHLCTMPGVTASPTFLPGPGYGFGLGFAVRTSIGGAYSPGSIGDFNWSGLGGTYFWIDPVEDLIAIWMMQAPEQRAHYRQLYRNLVYAAI